MIEWPLTVSSHDFDDRFRKFELEARAPGWGRKYPLLVHPGVIALAELRI